MKSLSVTWPWAAFSSPLEVVRHAKKLGCSDICIRAWDGAQLHGVEVGADANWAWTNYDLEREAKANGLTTSIWGPVYLDNWHGEAEAIKQSVSYYTLNLAETRA